MIFIQNNTVHRQNNLKKITRGKARKKYTSVVNHAANGEEYTFRFSTKILKNNNKRFKQFHLTIRTAEQ